MGNYMNFKDNDGCIKMDRILDGENKIYIGIGSIIENKSSQVIRIGDYKQKYYKVSVWT